ncbi:hypothetical protein ACFL0G_05335, partial [Candidatus Zixiibacteriota bacterium]
MKKSTIIIMLVMLTVLMWQGFPKTYRQAEAGELLKSSGVNELESFGECKPAELTLDERAARVIRFDVDAPPGPGTSRAREKGWQNIMTEDFEGLFPSGDWYTSHSTGASAYYWGRDDYNPYTGTYSAWCAGDHDAGFPDLDPATAEYPVDMSAWMVWGPFSLSDATDAEFLFYYWLDSETNYDFFSRMASVNGTNFFGAQESGNTGGWVGGELDLTDVFTLGDLTGQPEVWVACIFQSDDTVTEPGVFVDDLVLRQDVPGDQSPSIVHTPVTTAPSGSDVSISASITDDVAVTSAQLHYRQAGGGSFTAVAMTSAGDQYTGIIPGSVVTAPGVDYYLSAFDGTNMTYHPMINWETQPHEIQVQDAAPVIVHTPLSTVTGGTPLTITANITDDVAVTGADLYYRRGGESTFFQVSMTSAGDQYTGTVPGSQVASRGLEYYISAMDANNTSFDPADYLAAPHVVRVQVTNLTKPDAQPGGSEQTSYRMFSVPAELSNSSVAAVLEDDLGSYDDTRWRYLRYQDGAWREHPNSVSIAPGQAGWLIVSESGKIIDAGSATSVSTTDPFAITLRPGWNDIALPFDFPVPWRQITVDTASINGPYAYEGQWMLPLTVTYLAPWKGYSINNLTGSNITMMIPPIYGMTASGEETPQQVLSRRADINWFIQLSAQCDQTRDAVNFLGCAATASYERDALDLSEPPGVGDYVSLYFPHHDWSARPGNITTDFRQPIVKGDTWEFVVETNLPGAPVDLRWDNLESLPPSFNATLLD